MVFFTCDKCGEALKKNQVERHTYRCSSNRFSCIDCQKDFDRYSYNDHIKCITEDQKYGGANFVAKSFKGEAKQNLWVEQVSQAIQNVKEPKLNNLLIQIQGLTNIPRKEAKFINFLKNSLKIRDTFLCEKAWNAIVTEATKLRTEQEKVKEAINEKKSENLQIEDSTIKNVFKDKQINENHNDKNNDLCKDNLVLHNDKKTTFKWKTAIKRKLKNVENNCIKYKILRKDVIKEYCKNLNSESNFNDKEILYEIFNNKLNSIGARIDGKFVYLN